jgi:DNA polymerase-3 subunit epsilon
MMRQVVLDTETTGLESSAGHRIIEIGCIELVNRRLSKNSFHCYVNPGRSVDKGALEVHGIDNDFLSTQPCFSDIAEDFLGFVSGTEMVIHNADFDVGFINHELRRLERVPREISDICQIIDTLSMARRMHPGQRNSLDALAKRYNVDISKRELHGALVDARILAEVYLAMTGGQVSLSLEGTERVDVSAKLKWQRINRDGLELRVLRVSPEEQRAHEAMLTRIREQSDLLSADNSESSAIAEEDE